MRGILLFATLLTTISTGSAHAAERIVSLSVCTDPFVILLADRDRIVGVSRLAADPKLSPVAELAAGLPVLRPTAEEILERKPDLVVTGSFARRSTVDMLTRLGVAMVRVRSVERLEQVGPEIDKVARAIGRPERGEVLKRAMLGKPGAGNGDGERPSAAIYRPGGTAPGIGNLATDILNRAGLDNQAVKLGIGWEARLPLEVLALSPPDLLILDSERHDRPGIGQGIMGHPALRRLAAAAPPIAFPIKWWLCSSPASADAIDALAETVNGIGKRP